MCQFSLQSCKFNGLWNCVISKWERSCIFIFFLNVFLIYTDRLYDANPSRLMNNTIRIKPTQKSRDTQVEPKHNNVNYTISKESSGLAENISYHNSNIVETSKSAWKDSDNYVVSLGIRHLWVKQGVDKK